jgi:raffinose/stachyose/melibiose transport system permease protein
MTTPRDAAITGAALAAQGALVPPSSRWRSAKGLAAQYFYVLPALAIVLGIVYYSIFYTVWLSGLRWDGLSPNPASVGLGNYVRVWNDPTFWATLRHTAIFSLVTLIQMAIGFFFALALHSRMRFVAVYKVILFLPVILSPAVMAPVFRRIFDANGAFNGLLEAVSLGGLAHPWLADPDTTLYILMVVNVWQWTGLSFMLYFASLTQIDNDVLEAGRIDGATNLASVWFIVLPMLSGTHLTLAILGIIGAFKTFDIVILITGGGPAGSSEFLSSYIYKVGIRQFDMGYASALSVVLLILSVSIAIFQSRLQRRRG